MSKQTMKIIAGTTTLVATDFTADSPRTPLWIFCNSTAGVITVNLPEIDTLPYLNAKIIIVDVAGTADTNAITIAPNAADTINSEAVNMVINTENGVVTLEIASTTQWIGKNGNVAGAAPTIVVAATNQAGFAGAPFLRAAVGQTVAVQNYNASGDAGTFQRVASAANTFADWIVIATEDKTATGAIGSAPI